MEVLERNTWETQDCLRKSLKRSPSITIQSYQVCFPGTVSPETFPRKRFNRITRKRLLLVICAAASAS